MTRTPPPVVRQSAVMGRTAVAVVIAFWQLPALGYLFGFTASSAISDLEEGNAIPLLWSFTFVISGLLMLLVYTLREETDKAVVEIGVLVLFSVAMGVYLTAIFARASTIEGRIAIFALLGSLIVNLIGRVVLLARQLRLVRYRRREAGL